MADRATRERLRRQADEMKMKKLLSEQPKAEPLAPPSGRPVKMRKCCPTPKGKTLPHLPDCPSLHVKPAAKKPRYGTPKQKDWRVEKKGRLPDGSAYAVRYDAAKKQWDGSLTILTPTEEIVFEGWSTGVFSLLHMLDGFYRDYLKEEKAKAVAEPAAAG